MNTSQTWYPFSDYLDAKTKYYFRGNGNSFDISVGRNGVTFAYNGMYVKILSACQQIHVNKIVKSFGFMEF